MYGDIHVLLPSSCELNSVNMLYFIMLTCNLFASTCDIVKLNICNLIFVASLHNYLAN